MSDKSHQLDRHWFKEWYSKREFIRRYFLPAVGIVFVGLLPFIVEKFITEDKRFLWLFAGYIFIALFTVIYRALEESQEKYLEELIEFYKNKFESADISFLERVKISTSISTLVKTKSTRFCNKTKELFKDGAAPDAEAVFKHITQPRDQIELTLGLLSGLFQRDGEHNKVRVVLFEPNADKDHFEFFSYFPPGDKPSMPEEEYKLDKGVPGKAYKRKTSIIISDIEKDLESAEPTFYVNDSTLNKPQGSVICYPVLDLEHSNVAFVLSIFIDKPNVISEEIKNRLIDRLDPFAERILLESRLFNLKENVFGSKE